MYSSDSVKVIVSTGICAAATIVAAGALAYVVVTVGGIAPIIVALASGFAMVRAIACWNAAHPWM